MGFGSKLLLGRAQRTLLMTPQYNGQEGIELALKILQHEFKLTMGLAGYVVSSATSTSKLTIQ